MSASARFSRISACFSSSPMRLRRRPSRPAARELSGSRGQNLLDQTEGRFELASLEECIRSVQGLGDVQCGIGRRKPGQLGLNLRQQRTRDALRIEIHRETEPRRRLGKATARAQRLALTDEVRHAFASRGVVITPHQLLAKRLGQGQGIGVVRLQREGTIDGGQGLVQSPGPSRSRARARF